MESFDYKTGYPKAGSQTFYVRLADGKFLSKTYSISLGQINAIMANLKSEIEKVAGREVSLNFSGFYSEIERASKIHPFAFAPYRDNMHISLDSTEVAHV